MRSAGIEEVPKIPQDKKNIAPRELLRQDIHGTQKGGAAVAVEMRGQPLGVAALAESAEPRGSPYLAFLSWGWPSDVGRFVMTTALSLLKIGEEERGVGK